ncbi:MAG: hypothetical protein RR510_14955 [Morganella sp. (in: enterobacteria)]
MAIQTASSAYDVVSDSASKVAGSVSETASSAWPLIEKIVTDGLIELGSDLLNDKEKMDEISIIIWERIPREVRFFISKDKYDEKFESFRLSSLSRVKPEHQNILLIDDDR